MMCAELTDVFEDKSWATGPDTSRSGPGSSLASTAPLRAALPGLFQRHGVRRFVDAPCGDWFWMRHVDLSGIDYLGADIAQSVISANHAAYARDGIGFQVLDLTSDPLPGSDLFLCRDCLFHLTFDLRWRFFENFADSDSKLLLLTVNHVPRNKDLDQIGGFAAFDPMLAPFNLPEPLERIWETAPEARAAGQSVPEGARARFGGRARSLGLWSRDQIARTVAARAEAGAS